MKKLKVGIIGTGSLAVYHMEAYKKNPFVEITAVCDFNEERARQKAVEYGAKEVYKDYKDMLKNSDIDAVSIITWNNTHAQITVDSLNAGKHTLCEKPPAINARQAILMEQTAKTAGKLLMFGFIRRFEERARLLKEVISNNKLGEIYYIKTGCLRRCGNPGGWFAKKEISGGGPLIDLGVHMIDLAMYLMGKPKPVSVFGNTFDKVGNMADVKGSPVHKAADYNIDHNEVEDMANGMIKFENGASIFVETSWTAHIKKDITYMQIFGSKGGAVLEPEVEIYGVQNNYPTDIKPVLKGGEFDFDGAFAAEINHFIDCILTDTECICPASDGVTIMKILDAIYESASGGRLIDIK